MPANKTVTIPISGRIPPVCGLLAVEAVAIVAPTVYPLVFIAFERNGVRQPTGLRLDLDRYQFIDHLPDEEQDREVRSHARELAEGLSGVLAPYALDALIAAERERKKSRPR